MALKQGRMQQRFYFDPQPHIDQRATKTIRYRVLSNQPLFKIRKGDPPLNEIPVMTQDAYRFASPSIFTPRSHGRVRC